MRRPAHWKLCWRAYLERDPRDAGAAGGAPRLYPHSDHADGSAAYWLGRLAEKGGDVDLARDLYAGIDQHFPHYYYSLLARQRLAEIGPPDGKMTPLAAAFFQSRLSHRAS